MKPVAKSTSLSLILATLLCAFAAPLPARDPNASDLDRAIKSGSFSGYLTNATAWLNEKAPTGDPDKITEHLSWLADAVTSKEQAKAMRTAAEQIKTHPKGPKGEMPPSTEEPE